MSNNNSGTHQNVGASFDDNDIGDIQYRSHHNQQNQVQNNDQEQQHTTWLQQSTQHVTKLHEQHFPSSTPTSTPRGPINPSDPHNTAILDHENRIIMTNPEIPRDNRDQLLTSIREQVCTSPRRCPPSCNINEEKSPVANDNWTPVVIDRSDGLPCVYDFKERIHQTNLGFVCSAVRRSAPEAVNVMVFDAATANPVPPFHIQTSPMSVVNFIGNGSLFYQKSTADTIERAYQESHGTEKTLHTTSFGADIAIEVDAALNPQKHAFVYSLTCRLRDEDAINISSITIHPAEDCSMTGCCIESSPDCLTWTVRHYTAASDSTLPLSIGFFNPIQDGKYWRFTMTNQNLFKFSYLSFDQRVAIKQSRRQTMLTSRGGDDPRREVLISKLTQSIFTPRIVAVHDSTVFDPTYHWIVTQYYPGKDLYGLLNSERTNDCIIMINRDKVGLMFAQLVLSIYYLHHYLQIAHLDLKPSNILIGDNGQLLLTDFGVARRITPRSAEYNILTNGDITNEEYLLRTQPRQSGIQLDPSLLWTSGGIGILKLQGAIKAHPIFGLMGTRDYMDSLIVNAHQNAQRQQREFTTKPPASATTHPGQCMMNSCPYPIHELYLCRYHYADRFGFDPRLADVFSLGIILFTMLFKVPPFCSYAQSSNKHYQVLVNSGSEYLARSYAAQYRTIYENCDPDAFRLIDAMVFPSPERRLFIQDVVHHPYTAKYLKLYAHYCSSPHPPVPRVFSRLIPPQVIRESVSITLFNYLYHGNTMFTYIDHKRPLVDYDQGRHEYNHRLLVAKHQTEYNKSVSKATGTSVIINLLPDAVPVAGGHPINIATPNEQIGKLTQLLIEHQNPPPIYTTPMAPIDQLPDIPLTDAPAVALPSVYYDAQGNFQLPRFDQRLTLGMRLARGSFNTSPSMDLPRGVLLNYAARPIPANEYFLSRPALYIPMLPYAQLQAIRDELFHNVGLLISDRRAEQLRTEDPGPQFHPSFRHPKMGQDLAKNSVISPALSRFLSTPANDTTNDNSSNRKNYDGSLINIHNSLPIQDIKELIGLTPEAIRFSLGQKYKANRQSHDTSSTASYDYHPTTAPFTAWHTAPGIHLIPQVRDYVQELRLVIQDAYQTIESLRKIPDDETTISTRSIPDTMNTTMTADEMTTPVDFINPTMTESIMMGLDNNGGSVNTSDGFQHSTKLSNHDKHHIINHLSTVINECSEDVDDASAWLQKQHILHSWAETASTEKIMLARTWKQSGPAALQMHLLNRISQICIMSNFNWGKFHIRICSDFLDVMTRYGRFSLSVNPIPFRGLIIPSLFLRGGLQLTHTSNVFYSQQAPDPSHYQNHLLAQATADFASIRPKAWALIIDGYNLASSRDPEYRNYLHIPVLPPFKTHGLSNHHKTDETKPQSDPNGIMASHYPPYPQLPSDPNDETESVLDMDSVMARRQINTPNLSSSDVLTMRFLDPNDPLSSAISLTSSGRTSIILPLFPAWDENDDGSIAAAVSHLNLYRSQWVAAATTGHPMYTVCPTTSRFTWGQSRLNALRRSVCQCICCDSTFFSDEGVRWAKKILTPDLKLPGCDVSDRPPYPTKCWFQSLTGGSWKTPDNGPLANSFVASQSVRHLSTSSTIPTTNFTTKYFTYLDLAPGMSTPWKTHHSPSSIFPVLPTVDSEQQQLVAQQGQTTKIDTIEYNLIDAPVENAVEDYHNRALEFLADPAKQNIPVRLEMPELFDKYADLLPIDTAQHAFAEINEPNTMNFIRSTHLYPDLVREHLFSHTSELQTKNSARITAQLDRGTACFIAGEFGQQRISYHLPIDIILTPNYPQEPPLICLFPVNGFCLSSHHPIVIPVTNHNLPTERFGVIDLPILRNWDPRSDLCTLPAVLEEIKWWFNYTLPPYISANAELSAGLGFPYSWYSNKLILEYTRRLEELGTKMGKSSQDDANIRRYNRLIQLYESDPGSIYIHYTQEDWQEIWSAHWHTVVNFGNTFACESLPYFHQLFPPSTQESHTDFFHPRAILTIKPGDDQYRYGTPVHPLSRIEGSPIGSTNPEHIFEPANQYQWATGQINYHDSLRQFLENEEKIHSTVVPYLGESINSNVNYNGTLPTDGDIVNQHSTSTTAKITTEAQ